VPENATAMQPMTQNNPVARPTVEVTLTEYLITMPDTVPRGVTDLHITNAGKENHNFLIEGNGISAKLANDLTRGDDATITLDLKPGTYSINCPVDEHKQKGMKRTLAVR
jgi:uncharacterized cupredoxin-like copper-binding protein